MKKYLLAFLVFGLLIMSNTESKATHLMGGEITAIQLHDSTYLVTLTAYRDTFGIPMDSIANFDVKDSSGNSIMTFSITYDTLISGNTLGMYPYGVEVYIFKDTLKLPGSGTFHISFLDCCRNGAIQNLSNPLGDNMYLTTTVTVFDSLSNSTPFFLVQPVVFLPRNTSWAYNPLPFDLNGDSLVWSLDTPLTNYNTPCAGYTAPSSVVTNPFSINSVTGSISWTASTTGNYNATVLVEEYRNNVKIGEIRRDMQFIVVNPIGSMAMMTNLEEMELDDDGNYHVTLHADERYSFAFYAEDPDTGDVVSMLAFGEPFLFQEGQRASFFTVKTGKTFGNEIEGTLIWKPTKDMVRNKPYSVVYRVSDGFNVMDYTILYTVEGPRGSSVGIETNENAHYLSIYPNPSKGVFNVSFSLNDKAQARYNIYDHTGRKVYSSRPMNFIKGENVFATSLDLQAGIYVIELLLNNKSSERQRIVVSE